MRSLLLVTCLLFCGCPASNSADAKKSSKATKVELDWETIPHPQRFDIYRTKISGGWLLTFQAYSDNNFMMQVEDPKHEWVVGKWEPVSHPISATDMYRLKVPTGWIVTTERTIDSAQAQFIFDAKVKDNNLHPNTQSWATK